MDDWSTRSLDIWRGTIHTRIQTRPIIYRLALVSNNRLVSVIYQYKPQSRPLCQQSELISPRNHLTVKVLSAQIEEVNTLKP